MRKISWQFGCLILVALLSAPSAARAYVNNMYGTTVSATTSSTTVTFPGHVAVITVANDGAGAACVAFDADASCSGTVSSKLNACEVRQFVFPGGGPSTLGVISASTSTVRVQALSQLGDHPKADPMASFGITGLCASPTYSTVTVVGSLTLGGQLIVTPSTQTVADSGNGSAATFTIAATSGTLLVTCSDADGCASTLSETSAVTGSFMTVVNMSSNAVTLSDTSDVSETAGTVTLGQYDSVQLVYATDRWVELGASNN